MPLRSKLNTNVNSPVFLRLEQLQPGDLLLFRPSNQYHFSEGIIEFVQWFLYRKHGHYDTVHVAICVDKDENNHPIIAHSTRKGKIFGYVKEPLLEMIERNHDDRPFSIFRHKNVEINQEIAKIAGNEKKNKGQTWSYQAAAYTVFCGDNVKASTAKPIKKLAKKNICSQFAFECLKIALTKVKNTKSTLSHYITPKTLESHLYNNTRDFHFHCYLGKEPLLTLRKEIESQITRMSKNKKKLAQEKAKKIDLLYKKQLSQLAEMPHLQTWEKILILLTKLLPEFKKSTGLGLFHTTSYTAINRLCRSMGVFERDIKLYQQEHQENLGSSRFGTK